jgi:hypothetical protein
MRLRVTGGKDQTVPTVRTRTADLLQLRVISQVLQGLAGVCKSRISKPIFLLCLALCCTVLRSRWCQSGVNITLVSTSTQDVLVLVPPPSSQGNQLLKRRATAASRLTVGCICNQL